MKLLRLVVLLAPLLWTLGADAQSVSGVAGFIKGSTGAAYSGPCDLGITCTNAWGAELMVAAYSGHALQGCLSSNISSGSCTSTFNIDFDGTHGLSSSQLTSQGCTTDSACQAGILYHQTASGCDLSVGGNWNIALKIRPSTTENGHATLYADTTSPSSTRRMVCTDTISATSFTMMSAGTAAVPSGQGNYFGMSDVTILPRLIQYIPDAPADMFAQVPCCSNSPAANAPSGLACMGMTNGASLLTLYINGVASSNTGGTANTGTTVEWSIGNDTSAGAAWTGEVDAFAVFVNKISDANAISVGHAMGAFWAASNPC